MADEQEFAVLERALVADTRKGVRDALAVARRRLDAQRVEMARVKTLYDFENGLAAARGGATVVGLDEVGRGPLAGPLAVGAVVLSHDDVIGGLNDSKQVRPEERERIAGEIRARANACTVCYSDADCIDSAGMTASLKSTFLQAIRKIEEGGTRVDVIVVDGNPLHLDEREVNVVKGDAKCASVAAASILAKVARDNLMVEYDALYPGYGFAANKGYGTAEHIAAIREKGLCPIHRRSFCTAFLQETLF